MRYMRRLLVDSENGRWKRTTTPYEMSDWHYRKSFGIRMLRSTSNEYVEIVPEDFRQATFERVADTDWPAAREKVYHVGIENFCL